MVDFLMKITLLSSAEYRNRAARCREKAERSPAMSDEYLIIAAHWDVLSDHVEALLRYKEQLREPRD
jgi:hypothetical protein